MVELMRATSFFSIYRLVTARAIKIDLGKYCSRHYNYRVLLVIFKCNLVGKTTMKKIYSSIGYIMIADTLFGKLREKVCKAQSETRENLPVI